jgi:cation diffusion facilitator CzcD-associated flavoprotein CzcO
VLEYPSHLTAAQFQEYIESYARHFDLLKDMVFNASVTRATRNQSDTKWCLEMLVNGEQRMEEFDTTQDACIRRPRALSGPIDPRAAVSDVRT